MIRDLFEEDVRDVQLAPGATSLGGFALWFEAPCLTALQRVVEAAPFRHMVTPGGHRMSVAMTNCGAVGWVTDQTGYLSLLKTCRSRSSCAVQPYQLFGGHDQMACDRP